uniref:Uncharacterized protein n=1 Tax=Anguilla anguilla TaxID=7936 RepID=A0A0E9SRF2_ANGAN
MPRCNTIVIAFSAPPKYSFPSFD